MLAQPIELQVNYGKGIGRQSTDTANLFRRST
jgi:hypothetical protein